MVELNLHAVLLEHSGGCSLANRSASQHHCLREAAQLASSGQHSSALAMSGCRLLLANLWRPVHSIGHVR